MLKVKTQFCEACRTEDTYHFRDTTYKGVIRDKEYVFNIVEAVCDNCGEVTTIPGIIDYNVHLMDRQYRDIEGIVTIEDINSLMEVYKLGKAPLSLALGFGEITITRYLQGQIPSVEYSNIIKKALESPDFMLKKIEENKGKIGDTAYKKAKKAIDELTPLFSLSEKMLLTISYIFKIAEEITPLALQKILYYVQAIYMVLYDKELFEEDCQAWAHGPVYRNVYEAFKSFRYNPIEDVRFSLFGNRFNELNIKERKVVETVVESFGLYSGKTLERITHTERPWLECRRRCLPNECSDEIITKKKIKEYFTEVRTEYDLSTVEGLKKYAAGRLHPVTLP